MQALTPPKKQKIDPPSQQGCTIMVITGWHEEIKLAPCDTALSSFRAKVFLGRIFKRNKMPELSASFRVQTNHTTRICSLLSQLARVAGMQHHKRCFITVPPASPHDPTGCTIQQRVTRTSWHAQDRKNANSWKQLQLNQSQTATCASENRILPPVRDKTIQQSSNELHMHWSHFQFISRAFVKLRKNND